MYDERNLIYMKKNHQKTVEQSKTWLMQAFFRQLAQMPYDAITITGIAQQAQLSRRTFYRHFTTKDDLLQQYLEILFDRYVDLLLQKNIARHEDTLQCFFTFWQHYAPELRLLQKQGLFEQVLHMANQWYPTMYRKLQVPWHCHCNEEEMRYVSAFGAGGYFNILSLWIQRGCPETPAEMVTIVKTLLQALRVW